MPKKTTPKPNPLTPIRRRITALDNQILSLLTTRLSLVEEIIHTKETHSLPIFQPNREKNLLASLQRRAPSPLIKKHIKPIFTPILNLSKDFQFHRRLRNFKKTLPPTTFGIIGYGRFGRLLFSTLKKHWPSSTLYIVSKNHPPDNRRFFPLSKMSEADFIFPCVPIRSLRDLFTELSPHLTHANTLVEISTVKVLPTQWMLSAFGQKTNLISSHPMFGPQSTQNGTTYRNLNMMIHNLSTPPKTYQLYKNFWSHLGVSLVEITPEEHDRHAAYSINFNHLIGRLARAIGITPTPIDTLGFRAMYKSMYYSVNNSFELFSDMQTYNPYAQEMFQHLKTSLHSLEKKLYPTHPKKT